MIGALPVDARVAGGGSTHHRYPETRPVRLSTRSQLSAVLQVEWRVIDPSCDSVVVLQEPTVFPDAIPDGMASPIALLALLSFATETLEAFPDSTT